MEGNKPVGVIDTMIVPLAMLLFLGFLYFMYTQNHVLVNGWAVKISYGLIYPLSFFSGSKEMALAQLRGYNLNSLGLKDIYEILSYANKPYSYLAIPLAVYFMYQVNSKEFISKYTRRLNMIDLIENNAKILPYLKPIASRNGSIIDEPIHTGAWALPVKPIQWIERHRMLVNGKGIPFPKNKILDKNGMPHTNPDKTELLSQSKKIRKQVGARIDEKRITRAFLAQLGPKLETDKAKIAGTLKDYEAGIVASLFAYGLGEKKKGYAYICTMSNSFEEGVWCEKTKTASGYKLEIGDAREYITEVLTRDEIDETLAITFKLHGAYKYTWIMSLLEDFASEKGVFNSALYIFLRPTDNLLFLCLNQVGGNVGWIEAYGVWAHYEMEKTARYAILDNAYSMELAIKYLNVYLKNQGWIGYDSETYY